MNGKAQNSNISATGRIRPQANKLQRNFKHQTWKNNQALEQFGCWSLVPGANR
jgi:hypothetical protein